MEIKQVSYFDEHWYRFETNSGVIFLPSVTTKLGVVNKSFLARWRGDIGNREADMRLFEGQERGSRLHRAFETFCKGGTVVFNPQRYPTYTKEEIVRAVEFLEKCAMALPVTDYDRDHYLWIARALVCLARQRTKQ